MLSPRGARSSPRRGFWWIAYHLTPVVAIVLAGFVRSLLGVALLASFMFAGMFAFGEAAGVNGRYSRKARIGITFGFIVASLVAVLVASHLGIWVR